MVYPDDLGKKGAYMVDSKNDKSSSIELLVLLDKISMYRRNIIRTLNTGELGLSINTTEERVLMVISKMPELNMKELSEQVGLEKSTLTRVIDSLIDEGLVMRTNDQQDRRKVNCSLTENGLTIASTIEGLMAQHIKDCFSELPEEDMATLIHELKNVIDTMTKCLTNISD